MAAEPLITYDWCASTGGSLTAEQKRLLAGRSLATFAQHGAGLARLVAGRRDERPVRLPDTVDSKVVDLAVEACADQGRTLEGHGLRTWLFGGALADRDGVTLEPELFCVAAIAHDAGAAMAIVGEDFTVRSARIAEKALDHAGIAVDEAGRARVRDGIVAHATAGVTVDESAIGTYVQAGAMLDLVGLRLADLPRDTVREVFDRHSNRGLKKAILRLVEEEAAAVPDGRFAQLRRLGLTAAVRLSPTTRGA